MTGQDGSVVYNGTPHNHTPIYSSEGKDKCHRTGVVQGCSRYRMVSGMLSQKEIKTCLGIKNETILILTALVPLRYNFSR
jgi:hypothetical protein